VGGRLSFDRNILRWRVPAGLALVLLVAASYRVLVFYFYSRAGVLFDGLMLDASVYDTWAKRIAAGEWIGNNPFYFSPLYPYLLAVLSKLADPPYVAVKLIQAGLGLVSIALIDWIGTRLYGERAGLCAAAGAALYLPFTFFETKVLGTTLGVTLALVALVLLVRAEEVDALASEQGGRRGPAPRRPLGPWLAAGAAVGIAALCTPAATLLAASYAVVLGLRRRVPAGAALVAGTLLGILPALAHNVATGNWILISSQGGITFYQGNNPTAVGMFMPPPGFTGAAEQQAAEEKTLAERATGRSMTRSEVSSYWFHKGLDFVLDSPGAWLALEGKKLLYLLGSYEAATEYSQYVEREQVKILWGAFLPFAVILAAAAGGLLMGRAEDDETRGGSAGRRALLLYTIWAAVVPMIFYVSSRYRIALVPALLIYGGSFVDRAIGALRAGGAPSPALARGLLGGLALGLVSFFPLGRPVPSIEANVHYNLARILADRGQNEEALAEIDRCLADSPTHVFALFNRGNALDRMGRTDEALAAFKRAEEVRPSFFKAYQAEGAILTRLEQWDDAIEVYKRATTAGGPEAWFLLGQTQEFAGRLDEARESLQRAIALKADDPRFHNTLGMVLQRSGDREAAKASYRRANALDPNYERSRYNLGSLLLGQRDYAEARRLFEEAVRIDPRYTRARVRLGDALFALGDEAGARKEYTEALATDPEDPWAKAGMVRLGQMKKP
jgi:tetratricopeptide (TPR) repeat protein